MAGPEEPEPLAVNFLVFGNFARGVNLDSSPQPGAKRRLASFTLAAKPVQARLVPAPGLESLACSFADSANLLRTK